MVTFYHLKKIIFSSLKIKKINKKFTIKKNEANIKTTFFIAFNLVKRDL